MRELLLWVGIGVNPAGQGTPSWIDQIRLPNAPLRVLEVRWELVATLLQQWLLSCACYGHGHTNTKIPTVAKQQCLFRQWQSRQSYRALNVEASWRRTFATRIILRSWRS